MMFELHLSNSPTRLMGLPYVLHWGGFGGQCIGIYGSPMKCLGLTSPIYFRLSAIMLSTIIYSQKS